MATTYKKPPYAVMMDALVEALLEVAEIFPKRFDRARGICHFGISFRSIMRETYPEYLEENWRYKRLPDGRSMPEYWPTLDHAVERAKAIVAKRRKEGKEIEDVEAQ